MATFLEDLKQYLTDNNLTNIYRDFLPDKPDDAIGLFLWSHVTPEINDGSGVRYIQVQARAIDGDDAYRTAHAAAALLDSGSDEQRIDLTADRWCIARPRSMPRKLKTDESGRVVYYFDVALWSANTP